MNPSTGPIRMPGAPKSQRTSARESTHLRALRRMILASVIVLACVAVLPSPAAAKPKPVWLCKPGIEDNPCETSLNTTLLTPSGEELGIEKVEAPKRRRIDCFYVYPTASDQPTPLADRSIDPALRSIALYQAARYSRYCRVFAPVYRQVTFAALFGRVEVPEEMAEVPYSDIVDAWRTYLEKYNRGRGVVLIGHSQGARMLTRLVAEEIEPRRAVRRRLVSALLLGGNVTVKAGRDIGGDFQRIEACRAQGQLRCVVAFSTFNGPVPADARFGRTSEPGRQVLCTNPAALRGGTGRLELVYPREPFPPGSTLAAAASLLTSPPPPVSTPWLEYQGAYRGECSSADGANVLQISGVPGAPVLNPSPDATWGLHVADGNIALGNLTKLVRTQARRFDRTRGS